MTTSSSALERIVRRRDERAAAAVEERCDVCAVPIPTEHRHVLDLDEQGVLCACTACSILFDKEGAGAGKYRVVPRRRRRLEADPEQEELDVPVGLAFFVRSSHEGRIVAHYPSPMGATRWDLDVETWDAMEARSPELRELEPDVEALLVHTARGANERWIVPIDDCYRLVAVIRREWTGLSGGGTVWAEVTRFFEELGPPAGRPRAQDGGQEG